MLRFIEYFLIKWTSFARTASWAMVVALFALTAVAGWYAAGRLKVNTDTSSMIDRSLDFQVKAAALRDAFPSIKSDILVIVEGPTIDETEAFTAALAATVAAQPETFSDVFAPSSDRFFLEN